MGGVNCPPPDKLVGQIPDSLVKDYKVKLAGYCESLFAASAYFYQGNVAIERSVSGVADVKSAIGYMNRSVGEFVNASHRLASVSSLMKTMGMSTVFVPQQVSNISRVIKSLSAARDLIADMKVVGDVQDSLWERDDIREALSATVQYIGESLSWQCRFASWMSSAFAECA